MNLRLTPTALHEPGHVINLSDLRPDALAEAEGGRAAPSGLSPLETRWWDQAIRDIGSNVVDGRYFGAGREFGPTVFTRDIALSAVLSLNRLYAERVWSSLEFDRELRDRVGWRVVRDSPAAEIAGLPFERTPHDFAGFVGTYHTGDFSRRTDDVVWLWAALDWLERNPRLAGEDKWRWAYVTGRRCFSAYYDRFFDPDDGLYRGQACFVDIMMCGYPSRTEPGATGNARDFLVRHVDDPVDTSRWRPGRFPATLRESIMGKAASTNALYVLGLGAMARLAARLGKPDESTAWIHRRDNLIEAMRREFFRTDGGIRYHKAEDGGWNERQHALGTALCVLAGVVEGGAARRALEVLPRAWWGVPLYDPFYADNPHVYHNRSAWPFVDALVHLADRRARPDVVSREAGVAVLGRACRDARGFRELTEAGTGRLIGSDHQLWSAAGYCAVVMEP